MVAPSTETRPLHFIHVATVQCFGVLAEVFFHLLSQIDFFVFELRVVLSIRNAMRMSSGSRSVTRGRGLHQVLQDVSHLGGPECSAWGTGITRGPVFASVGSADYPDSSAGVSISWLAGMCSVN